MSKSTHFSGQPKSPPLQWMKRLQIIDSTTITLFSNLLFKGVRWYIKGKEVDFVAIKGDRTIYPLMLLDKQAIEREHSALGAIDDSYEKFVVSLDSTQLFSRGGIRHIQAWNLNNQLR